MKSSELLNIRPKSASATQLRGAERFSTQIRHKVLERFLFAGWTHRELQAKVLGLPAPQHGGGFKAMYILHCFGFGGDDTRGLFIAVKSQAEVEKCIKEKLTLFSSEQQGAVRQAWIMHSRSTENSQVSLNGDYYTTYRNNANRHVTIHISGCAQIKKRGGKHKHENGEYATHRDLNDAIRHAQATGYPTIYCSFCNPSKAKAVTNLYNESSLWKYASKLSGRILKTKRGCVFRVIDINEKSMEVGIGKHQRSIYYGREIVIKFCKHRMNGGEITPESLRKANVHMAKKRGYSYLPIIVDEILKYFEPKRRVAIDLKAPKKSRRIKQTTERIMRDSELSKRVKYDSGYRCSICGTALELKDGSFYAEAHHIKPLGGPHNGPDILENIICVCPNHHALLDFGAIKLDEKVKGIGNEFLEYHNKVIYGDL